MCRLPSIIQPVVAVVVVLLLLLAAAAAAVDLVAVVTALSRSIQPAPPRCIVAVGH